MQNGCGALDLDHDVDLDSTRPRPRLDSTPPSLDLDHDSTSTSTSTRLDLDFDSTRFDSTRPDATRLDLDSTRPRPRLGLDLDSTRPRPRLDIDSSPWRMCGVGGRWGGWWGGRSVSSVSIQLDGQLCKQKTKALVSDGFCDHIFQNSSENQICSRKWDEGFL